MKFSNKNQGAENSIIQLQNGWGQFTPKYWGQFAPEYWGQFHAEKWGLFGRNFQNCLQKNKNYFQQLIIYQKVLLQKKAKEAQIKPSELIGKSSCFGKAQRA